MTKCRIGIICGQFGRPARGVIEDDGYDETVARALGADRDHRLIGLREGGDLLHAAPGVAALGDGARIGERAVAGRGEGGRAPAPPAGRSGEVR